jgi:hypothetical protein
MLSLIAETTNTDIALILAVILFAVAGVLSCLVPFRSYVMALVSFGLAAFAMAFLITG